MAYIGPKPSQTLATPTSQYFNGTGSQTVFTLNRAVNVPEDLEVFVNNIQQEPGVGKSYTATGTTLTFDGAPSSGTANVYVVYRGLAEVTTRLEHDPNAALAATTGTFSGNVDVTGAISSNKGSAGTLATFTDGVNSNFVVETSSLLTTIGNGGGSTALAFKANNTEAMRISSGNLLVGQSTTALPGLGNTTTGISLAGQYDIIAASRTSGAAVLVNRNSDDGDLVQFSRDGNTVGEIGVNNSDNLRIQGNSGHSGIEFGTNAIFPHKNSSNVDATIDLGESTLRWKDLWLSGGVYLGGTGSANHLEDYEEGNWTPQFGGSSTTGTGTYSTTVGRYVKVGKKVNCWGIIVSSGTHNGTGTLQIHGLPFTKENTYLSWGTETSIAYHISLIPFGTATNVIRLLGPVSNGTYIRFHSFQNSGDTSVPPTPANVQSGTAVYFATTYEVQ